MGAACAWVLAMAALLAACGRKPSAPEESGPPVPLQQDPTHHLVLENEYVRVYRVSLAPGASTKLHRHDRDYVSVILSNAQLAGFSPGRPRESIRRQEGQVRFTPAGLIHGNTNTGTSEFRCLVVELLKPLGDKAESQQAGGERALDIGHGHVEDVLLDNPRVRVTELQIAPGAGTDENAGGHPRLLVWLEGGELIAEDGEQIRGSKGELSWLRPGGGRMRNAGHHPAHVMLLEFK
jgi:quercetin dioxygenase-like cupin family protein